MLIFYLLASIYIVETPVDILLQNLLYVCISNLLGMIICYFIEFTARRDFILVHLYQEEREKVAAVNQELEKRVKALEREALKRKKGGEAELQIDDAGPLVRDIVSPQSIVSSISGGALLQG